MIPQVYNWTSLDESLNQPEGLWRTREDRVIPIEGMSDSHILNTIRYLVRTAYYYALDRYTHPGYDDFDRNHEDRTPLKSAQLVYPRKLRELTEEADRRKIDWKRGLPQTQSEAQEHQHALDDLEKIRRDADLMNDVLQWA